MFGSILFVKTSSPISWIIRKLTKSEYSHVCLSVSNDNSLILESDVFKRVGIRKNRYKDFVTVDIKMSQPQRTQLMKYMYGKLNKKYDYLYVLGFFLKTFGLIKNENLFDVRNRFMCSEIIDEGYYHIGIDLVPNRASGDVTPADLANALLERKD